MTQKDMENMLWKMMAGYEMTPADMPTFLESLGIKDKPEAIKAFVEWARATYKLFQLPEGKYILSILLRFDFVNFQPGPNADTSG